jgi:hypothetical protein
VFRGLTVRENLLLGAYAKRARADERARLKRVLSLFPKLARMAQRAGTMSGGDTVAIVWRSRTHVKNPAIADRGYLIENGRIIAEGRRRICAMTRQCHGLSRSCRAIQLSTQAQLMSNLVPTLLRMLWRCSSSACGLI